MKYLVSYYKTMAKVVTFNNVVEFMEKGNKYYENLNCNIILRAPTQEEIKNINYKPIVVYPVKRPYLDELKFVLSAKDNMCCFLI
jgi:hypothetical protein